MKMRSMAENVGKLETAGSQSPQPYYPTFSVDSTQLPEAKKWEVGKKYTVMMEVQQSGMRIEGNGRQTRYDFKMLRIGASKKKKEESYE